jgi:hypothetical protein
MTSPRHPGVVGVLAALLALAGAVLVGGPLAGAALAAGTASAGPEWGESTLDGRRVEGLDSGEPVPLSSDDPLVVRLAVENSGGDSVEVFEVRVTGRVMGMTFFRYATQVGADVVPGTVLERTITLDLDDLDDQAVGLVPSTLALVDPDGEVVLEQPFAADVDGSLWSDYGVFGLAVAGSTLVLLGSLLWRIWRGALPANRWRRALQFLPVGAGVGLTLTFTLSATGLLAPSGTAWTTFCLVCTAAAFLLGYLLPLPYADS